jgi:Na+/H+ antiporter NhaD/arsenite permease-like protein
MFTGAEWAAIAVVAATLVLVAWREQYRLAWAAGAGALLLLVGLVPWSALPPTNLSGNGGILQWNTLALLLGLFVFATLLGLLGFFEWTGRLLAHRTRGRPLLLFVGLVALAFALSAFLDSIVVMLILAAVTLEAARSTGVDPIPLIVAEISAANLGGAATLVGDPPNLILGTYFHLTFTDFLVHTGTPALAGLGVAVLLFSRGVNRTPADARGPIDPPALLARARTLVALGVFGGLMVLLAFQESLGVPVWAIGIAIALAGLALAGPRLLSPLVRRVDFGMLVFFLLLFLLVGSLETTGVIDAVAGGIGAIGSGNLLLTGTLLLWSFGLLSSAINSVPLAAAAAPLIARLSSIGGFSSASLVYAVALGNDIGGSGTPVGASGNVVGLGVAARGGYPISWSRFVRQSFPVMLACLATANVVWWLVR